MVDTLGVSIKSLTAVFLWGASVQLLSGIGYAQGTATTPDTAGPQASADDSTEAPAGIKDFLLRTVKVQGQARIRLEGPQGASFTTTPADAYTMTRLRFGIAFAPEKWLRAFAEAEDSRVEFYKVSPNNTVSDPFELRQAYIEAGTLEGNGVKARLGRQDLFIGSNRLLTTGDWSNITKSFDVVRGTITEGMFKADLIAGSVVQADPNRMDRNKAGEHFYVAYTSWNKLIPAASLEPYVMAKTALNVKGKDGKLGDADTLYGGLRLIGTLHGGFDYNGEAIREGGDFGNDTVQAFGYVAGAGWSWFKQAWKPHFSAEYAWASGDSGRKDGHHESFDYLYGSQQPLTSLTGMFAWRNLGDLRAGVEFAPIKKLKVKLDYRDYWLANVHDGLYNGFGTRTVLNAKATSNHVGEGLESQFIMTVTPKTILGLGAGNVTPGAYLKQSGKGGYIYPYLTFARTL